MIDRNKEGGRMRQTESTGYRETESESYKEIWRHTETVRKRNGETQITKRQGGRKRDRER